MTKENTFESLENWVLEFEKYTDDSEPHVIVVGNKSDLEKKRKISIQKGEEWAKENGFE